mmetsp:Transcript_3022/g.11605  ORF Transcript_3022/g.11605 Transcript_3022/m.11605 type:complete len:201 (-) Transcript_3022:576-1178(-)
MIKQHLKRQFPSKLGQKLLVVQIGHNNLGTFPIHCGIIPDHTHHQIQSQKHEQIQLVQEATTEIKGIPALNEGHWCNCQHQKLHHKLSQQTRFEECTPPRQVSPSLLFDPRIVSIVVHQCQQSQNCDNHVDTLHCLKHNAQKDQFRSSSLSVINQLVGCVAVPPLKVDNIAQNHDEYAHTCQYENKQIPSTQGSIRSFTP